MELIRVNMAPPEELENPIWWWPEALFVVATVIVCFLATGFILDQKHDRINEISETIKKIDQQLSNLKPEIDQFDNMKKDITAFSNNLAALSEIAGSSVKKYKTIIALEKIQARKPEGIWFAELEMLDNAKADSEAGEPKFRIVGYAFDNILVSEFMASLRATKIEDFDPVDLRTQVYFDDVELKESFRTDGSIFYNVVNSQDKSSNQGSSSSVNTALSGLMLVKWDMSLVVKVRQDGGALPVSFRKAIERAEDKLVLASLSDL